MTPLELHNFFWALMFLIQNMLPVFGILLLISEIEVEKWVLDFIKTLVPICGIFYFTIGENMTPRFPCHDLVLFYCLAMPLFLHFLQNRNPDKTTKVLGIFLLVANLFSQYWEIPVFIAGHLNILGAKYLGSIDQLYLILVFYLAAKYANLSIAKETVIYLSIPIVFSAIALYAMPIGNPQMPLGYIVRGVSCFCLGKVFIDRSIL